MANKKIVIAGGTGFLGGLLTELFINQGYEIVILSRKHHADSPKVRYFKWDARTLGYWSEQLEDATALINLTGKSVDCRYNESNKQQIYDTRIDSTYILGEAFKSLKSPPKVWLNASSATIYRHAMDREMDEETGEFGKGFSVDVCKKWEKMFNEIDCRNTRKIILRIGIVLGKSNGALQPLKVLTKLGFGGKHGDGKQYFSWIHERDFCSIIQYTIENSKAAGVYNVSAPNPITNRVMMKALRKSMKVPLGLPLPEWALSIGAVIIKTETELILKSRRVVPRRLLDSGYKFRFAKIHDALNELIG